MLQLQVQQALHRRAARLKKAGQRVSRKQQELMHVVHVSADQRKVKTCLRNGLNVTTQNAECRTMIILQK